MFAQLDTHHRSSPILSEISETIETGFLSHTDAYNDVLGSTVVANNESYVTKGAIERQKKPVYDVLER